MTAAESCRSASPGDPMTDSYRGDSCGSFEFLNSKHRRGSSNRRDTEESDEEDRLFFPQRNEEKEAILRQIQTLNDNLGDTTEESRESSAQPESTRYYFFLKSMKQFYQLFRKIGKDFDFLHRNPQISYRYIIF